MSIEEVRKLIEELNLRVSKDYQKMDTNQLSGELREVMKFERDTFEKIEILENKGTEQDLLAYTKTVLKNTTEREIAKIQEVYLKKIDKEYLNSN